MIKETLKSYFSIEISIKIFSLLVDIHKLLCRYVTFPPSVYPTIKVKFLSENYEDSI